MKIELDEIPCFWAIRKNKGQEDLGCLMIESMHPKRLDIQVFHLQILPGRADLDNACSGLCD